MRRDLHLLLICVLAGAISGCGSGSKKAAVQTPDFTVAASPSSLTLSAGGAAQPVSISATALNGFSGTIQVAITGLPAGVTATPATLSLAAGTPQQV
ncbi:MAG TPA: hypothetical protein VJS11_04505, partial [Acidobacteriaceae bacterium]|nr:hypothetical protein [Acidobacteriaceae bacterium]